MLSLVLGVTKPTWNLNLINVAKLTCNFSFDLYFKIAKLNCAVIQELWAVKIICRFPVLCCNHWTCCNLLLHKLAEHLNIKNFDLTLLKIFIKLWIFIIIIIKRDWQCKAGSERLTPYQSEDPNPTTPTHRKKEEKGKTVGDKKWASS